MKYKLLYTYNQVFFLAQSNLILYTQFLPKKKYKKSFKSIICNIKRKLKKKSIN